MSLTESLSHSIGGRPMDSGTLYPQIGESSGLVPSDGKLSPFNETCNVCFGRRRLSEGFAWAGASATLDRKDRDRELSSVSVDPQHMSVLLTNPSSLPTQEYHWSHQGRPRPRAWYYCDHPCLGVSALVGIPCPLIYTNGFFVVSLFVSF